MARFLITGRLFRDLQRLFLMLQQPAATAINAIFNTRRIRRQMIQGTSVDQRVECASIQTFDIDPMAKVVQVFEGLRAPSLGQGLNRSLAQAFNGSQPIDQVRLRLRDKSKGASVNTGRI